MGATHKESSISWSRFATFYCFWSLVLFPFVCTLFFVPQIQGQDHTGNRPPWSGWCFDDLSLLGKGSLSSLGQGRPGVPSACWTCKSLRSHCSDKILRWTYRFLTEHYVCEQLRVVDFFRLQLPPFLGRSLGVMQEKHPRS